MPTALARAQFACLTDWLAYTLLRAEGTMRRLLIEAGLDPDRATHHARLSTLPADLEIDWNTHAARGALIALGSCNVLQEAIRYADSLGEPPRPYIPVAGKSAAAGERDDAPPAKPLLSPAGQYATFN